MGLFATFRNATSTALYYRGNRVDHLTGEELEKFIAVRDKFMTIFEREER